KPQLDPEAREAIRGHMLNEFRTLQTPQPIRPRFSAPQILALVAVVVIVIVGVVLILQPGAQNNGSSLDPTAATQVAIAPSETLPDATRTNTPTHTESPTTTFVTERSVTTVSTTNTPTIFPTATPIAPSPTTTLE